MAEGIRYFLDITDTGGNGGGDNGGGGGNGGGGLLNILGKGNKDIKNELEKGNKGGKKGLGATLGIKFGVASLLKQSQVFTGFVGTIFQLMGALVDVILAPFLPILIPGIRLIASLIPYVAQYARAVFDFLDRTLFRWFNSFAWSDEVKEAIKKGLSAIIVGVLFMKVLGVWNVFKSIVKNFIGKPIWGLFRKVFPQVDTFFQKFAGKSMSDIIQMGGKHVLNTIIKPMWDNLLIRLMYFVDWATALPGKLVGGFKMGLRTEGETIVQKLVRFIWKDGIQAKLVTPVMAKLTSFANFILSPFKGLWGAVSKNAVGAGDGIIAKGLVALREFPFVKTITEIPHHITNLFNWIPKMISELPIVGTLKKWLGKELLGKLGALKGLAARGLGKLTGLADPGRALLSKAPGSGMISGMTSKLSPSALKKVAQGFKAIPILGAVAELGFGGWQTYKDYKKYGAKAAMGRAALTLANTTAALFDPTGLASAAGSIGSNVAMDIAYKKMLDPKDSWKRDNPDIWVQNPNPQTGVMEWSKVEKNKQDQDARSAVSMPTDRTTLDGMMY